MSLPVPRRRGTLAAAVLTTALLSGCAGTPGGDVAAAPSGSPVDFHGVEPQPVRARPSFALTDLSGERYDFAAETRGRPTLLYFGYTDCPDECPTALADITGALRQSDAALRDRFEVVFVTTDPQRDSPAALRAWLGRFGPRIVGLTGTPDEVAAAQQAAGIAPAEKGGAVPTLPGTPNEHAHQPGTVAHEHSRPLGYAVEHANVIFAYDAADRLPVLYPAGVTPADIAADLPALADPPALVDPPDQEDS